jgi:hypothetical protein
MKQMMNDQRKHELQWYQERQGLKQAQANRTVASAKAESILQSLGNASGSSVATHQHDPDYASELAIFDRKIYAAQVSMDEAMASELKRLGVPFFGTKQHLIGDLTSGGGGTDEQFKWSVTITESELVSLRRRMVGHLEDLYRD